MHTVSAQYVFDGKMSEENNSSPPTHTVIGPLLPKGEFPYAGLLYCSIQNALPKMSKLSLLTS